MLIISTGGLGLLLSLILIFLVLLMIPLGSALAGGGTVFAICATRMRGQPRRTFIAALIGSVIGYLAGLVAFAFVFMFFARMVGGSGNVLEPWTAGDSLMMAVIFLGPAVCSAICVWVGFQTAAWLMSLAWPRSRSKSHGKPRGSTPHP